MANQITEQPDLPASLIEAIDAARAAEKQSVLAEKKSQRAMEESARAQEQAKAFLVQRDAHRVECGRQIILIKKLYAEVKVNMPWKQWAPEQLRMSYATIARRMQDATKPEKADERRDKQNRRDQVSRNPNRETAPLPKSDIDPTQDTAPDRVLSSPFVVIGGFGVNATDLIRRAKELWASMTAEQQTEFQNWVLDQQIRGDTPTYHNDGAFFPAVPTPLRATPANGDATGTETNAVAMKGAQTETLTCEAPSAPVDGIIDAEFEDEDVSQLAGQVVEPTPLALQQVERHTVAPATHDYGWWHQKPPVACAHHDGVCQYEGCAHQRSCMMASAARAA
jgi:hypothetical protein